MATLLKLNVPSEPCTGGPASAAMLMAAVVVLTIIARLWGRYRHAAQDVRRQAGLRKQRGFVERQQQEIERLAGRIVATSSTASIAGFTIVRQIEAVFVDGLRWPEEAIAGLKAVAAMKGANGVINVRHAPSGTGRYSANGDAVVLEPIGDEVE